jgi:hypothetical protein
MYVVSACDTKGKKQLAGAHRPSTVNVKSMKNAGFIQETLLEKVFSIDAHSR